MLGWTAEHLGTAAHLVAKCVDQNSPHFVTHLPLHLVGFLIVISERHLLADQGARQTELLAEFFNDPLRRCANILKEGNTYLRCIKMTIPLFVD